MTFFIASLLLTVIAIAFVLAPLWLRRQDDARERAVVGLMATRLRELEQEWRSGLIEEATYRQLRLEQERRLLAEAGESAGRGPGGQWRWLLPVCAVLVLGSALLLYRQLGGLPDWEIQRQLDQSQALADAGRDNDEQLNALAEALESRLAQVDDDEGRRRFLLARLALQLGQLQKAADQYRLLVEQFPQDAALVAQYAQALYLSLDRKLTPEVREQANRALALDADQTTALGLLGIAAFETGDYAGALTHWRRLRGLLPPASAGAQTIGEGIRRAEANLSDSGAREDKADSGEPAAAGPTLNIAVSLAPDLQLPAGGTLFVFARAVGGPPLPLAVVRIDQPQLPLQVTLSDAQAMAAGSSLSSALAAGTEVQVVARISTSGQVRAEAGDLEGASVPLRLDGEARSLTLTIDRRL